MVVGSKKTGMMSLSDAE